MQTISVCMIVKNEEKILARCLDTLKGIADEIIVCDTGSTDSTKEIAARYTDRIYDFKWTGDFSDARNFAFSKATCDYIYSADADEYLDEKNAAAFLNMKKCLLPEIEIVTMIYLNPEDVNMVYNDLRERRPKLFRRLRTFTWIDPIHETVRLDPVVFDSDIEIVHAPTANHAQRDFEAFKKLLLKDGNMSDRLFSMYAKELFFNGEAEDFAFAAPYFEKRVSGPYTFESLEAMCVVVRDWKERAYFDELRKFIEDFEKFPEKPAELDYLLGLMLLDIGDERAGAYLAASRTDPSFVCVTYKAK